MINAWYLITLFGILFYPLIWSQLAPSKDDNVFYISSLNPELILSRGPFRRSTGLFSWNSKTFTVIVEYDISILLFSSMLFKNNGRIS